jgi:hypothetical protein
MSQYGNIQLRSTARITNLPIPISDNEPGLARDACYFPMTGGRQFSQAVNCTPTATSLQQANVCRFSILEVRSSCIISTIQTEVTTLIAGALYRTCIYNVDNLLYPTTLVADGLVDQNAATIGTKTTNLAGNITLRAGLYLVGIKNSAAPTMRALDPRAVSPALGMSGALAPISGFTVPFTWVANTPFPATFPALTVGIIVQSAQPIFLFTSV